MQDLHLFIRPVKFDDQEIHLSASHDLRDLTHDEDAFAVIFFRQQSQRCLIGGFRVFFGEFLHLVLEFLFQRLFFIAVFQERCLTHRILERFRIGEIPHLHDIRCRVFRERFRRERLLVGCGSFRVFCVFRFLFGHQVVKFKFTVHFRDIQAAVLSFGCIFICLGHCRIFREFRFLCKIAGRVESVERVLPDFHRDLRVVLHVFVALLNERRRDRVKSAFLWFSSAKEDPPHDIMCERDGTQTAKDDFDQFAKNALLFLRGFNAANGSFCRRGCGCIASFRTFGNGRIFRGCRICFAKPAQGLGGRSFRFRSRGVASSAKIQEIDR